MHKYEIEWMSIRLGLNDDAEGFATTAFWLSPTSSLPAKPLRLAESRSASAPKHSCPRRRQEFHTELLRGLHHARDVLLLLLTQRADFLEESLEARWRDDTHEPSGCLAKVAVGVRYPTRRKNRRTFFGNERFPADGPLVLAFEDLERFVLAVMDVRRRTTAWHVV